MQITVVTGTDTGVGKTIACAALAVASNQVAPTLVVKPVQAGISATEPTDAEVVARLAAVPTKTLVSLDEPLAPATAARRAQVTLPSVSALAEQIGTAATEGGFDNVIVEGAGGVLVELDSGGGTICDLALQLGADVVVVTSLKLGTLNHTALTLQELRRRNAPVAGLLIGSRPAQLGLAEETNLEDLADFGLPVLGSIPEGSGTSSGPEFREQVSEWLVRYRRKTN